MKWFILIVLLGACHQAEFIPNTCGVNNPLQDLSWLKKLDRDDGLGSSIVQGTYNGQTIYVVSSCGRCINGSSITLYDCNGSVVCSGLGIATGCSQIISALTNRRTLVEHRP